MKSVVVTGAAGFLGFHLCQRLLELGYKVIGLDNLITGLIDNVQTLSLTFPQSFTFLKADITKPWPDISAGLETHPLQYVFHFASVASPELFEKYALEIMQANSLGLQLAAQTADLYQARCVFASTSEVYGSSAQSSFSEHDWGYVHSYGPRGCYDESKRYGEALLFSMNQKNQTRHGIVRIFNTYGPRMNPQDQRVIQYFIQRGLAGQAFRIYGDGLQTRSFCYVDDLIEGVIKYADSGIIEPVNLGNDHEITIQDLALCVKKILNCNSPIEFFNARTDDPIRRRPNLEKAYRLLSPWKPQTGLTEGLIKTSEFLKGNQ